ncbi:alpha/beta fold hydrolase, partial [Sanguibacter suaedae]
MTAPRYHLRDEVELPAPPADVWRELLAELAGGSRWWLPNNTFVPLSGPVDRVGASLRVEVRPGGRDSRGPVLTFVATTRTVEPHRRLAMDFVDGCFRGSWRFDVEALADGAASRLSVTFDAVPQGWVRGLARVVDVGAQHSIGVRTAFDALAARLTVDGAGERPSVADVARATTTTVTADDGLELRALVTEPLRRSTDVHVVLVHGWASGPEAWDDVADALVAEGVPVLRVELRGHGATPLGGTPVTIDLLTRDLVTVLDGAGVGDVVLVGHSGGGLVALSAAVRDDVGAQGLVLAASAAHGAPVSRAELNVLGSPLLDVVLRTRRGPEAVLARTMGPSRPFAGRDAVARAFARTGPRVRATYFGASSGADLRHPRGGGDVPRA